MPPIKAFKVLPSNTKGETLIAALDKRDEQASKNLPETSHIDIEDLSWQDKERILRILFAKMNGQSLTEASQSSMAFRNHVGYVPKGHRNVNGFGGNIGTEGSDLEVQSIGTNDNHDASSAPEINIDNSIAA